MDLEAIKAGVVTNVYHLDVDKKWPIHKHDTQDEVFYCIKVSGFGVLENGEQELKVGDAFIVRAGVMHSLRTDENLFVTSFLIPVIEDQT